MPVDRNGLPKDHSGTGDWQPLLTHSVMPILSSPAQESNAKLDFFDQPTGPSREGLKFPQLKPIPHQNFLSAAARRCAQAVDYRPPARRLDTRMCTARAPSSTKPNSS